MLGYICLATSIRSPYDVQITDSVRPPQGDPAIIVRIYGHRGLYDFVLLSTIKFPMGKCLWFSVKIKVCQSSLSSP